MSWKQYVITNYMAAKNQAQVANVQRRMAQKLLQLQKSTVRGKVKKQGARKRAHVGDRIYGLAVRDELFNCGFCRNA
jgi:hypothetical protein